jgi:hypothetical protein
VHLLLASLVLALQAAIGYYSVPSAYAPELAEQTAYRMPVPGGHSFAGSPVFEIAGKAILIPALFIAGDHDDVADHENGIKPAFDLATRADRCLLAYENARHNTGASPAPPEASRDFAILQAFDEPAWPKDRITSIAFQIQIEECSDEMLVDGRLHEEMHLDFTVSGMRSSAAGGAA